MENTIINKNIVNLTGEIVSEFTFDHGTRRENFYTAKLAVKRFSDQIDYLPLLVSENLINVNKDYRGKFISIIGQYRSFNIHDGEKTKLKLSVIVKTIEFVDEESVFEFANNRIILDGYICKPVIYRKTPMSDRDIADILIAVNRAHGRTDYIPCICWGVNARNVAEYELGTHVKLIGRIQSREYVKSLNDTESEIRVAYEVSVSKIDVLE